MSLFDGNWLDATVQHFCWKVGGGTCCASPKVAKMKMRASLRKVLVPLWGRVSSGATKKWCESSRASTATSFISHVHGLMRVATVPWRQRGPAAGDGVDSDVSSEVRADEDPSKKRRKREHKAGKFWVRRDTPNNLLAISIVTHPIRSLLLLFCEREERAALLRLAEGP